MLLGWSCSFAKLAFLIGVISVDVHLVACVVMPSSNCYALDNSSYLADFTDWIGHPFEYDGKDGDLVVRFCKDVESRSQTGYVDFGRYSTNHYFVPGSAPVNFVQGFFNGDLMNCEYSFDKMGRNAQVNIICGNCLSGACKGELGCICSVHYDTSKCRAIIELAIPCVKRGPRVFEAFTVGFHPRSWEVVYNGMTQLGYERPHRDFSFQTEQTHLSLYLTAKSSLSVLVGKPTLKINPDKGLEVTLSGSAASGSAPTTLSPSILLVNWRCMVDHWVRTSSIVILYLMFLLEYHSPYFVGLSSRDIPYEIDISIPIDGYDPVEFTLTKLCDYEQGGENDATKGWATFGVLSCIFIVLSTIFCCGGFIYKSRVDHQRGLDALPGIAILSACLETVTGPRGYMLGGDLGRNFSSQSSSWDDRPTSAQGAQRTTERKYGSI